MRFYRRHLAVGDAVAQCGVCCAIVLDDIEGANRRQHAETHSDVVLLVDALPSLLVAARERDEAVALLREGEVCRHCISAGPSLQGGAGGDAR